MREKGREKIRSKETRLLGKGDETQPENTGTEQVRENMLKTHLHMYKHRYLKVFSNNYANTQKIGTDCTTNITVCHSSMTP